MEARQTNDLDADSWLHVAHALATTQSRPTEAEGANPLWITERSLKALACVNRLANAAVYFHNHVAASFDGAHSPFRAAIDAHHVELFKAANPFSEAHVSLPAGICASGTEIRAWKRQDMLDTWLKRLRFVRTISQQWFTPSLQDVRSYTDEGAHDKRSSKDEGVKEDEGEVHWSSASADVRYERFPTMALTPVPAAHQSSEFAPSFVSSHWDGLRSWRLEWGEPGVDARLQEVQHVTPKNVLQGGEVGVRYRGALTSNQEHVFAVRFASKAVQETELHLDVFPWASVCEEPRGDPGFAQGWTTLIREESNRCHAIAANSESLFLAIESQIFEHALEVGGKAAVSKLPVAQHARLIWQLHASARKLLLSCSYDQEAMVHDLRLGQSAVVHLSHADSVNSCTWQRGGDLYISPLILTGTTSQLQLWDVRRPDTSIWGNSIDDSVLQVSLDGDRSLCGCFGGHIHAFETESGADLSPKLDFGSNFPAMSAVPRCGGARANEMLFRSSKAVVALLADTADIVVGDAGGGLTYHTLSP